MKRIKTYFALGCISLGMTTISCNDDFMQRDNQYQMAEGGFLASADALPIYLNQFYDLYAIGHGRSNAYDFQPPYYITRGSNLMYGDIYTDNMIGFSNSSGDIINRLNGTWRVPTTESTSLTSADRTGWRWDNVRSLNYFLDHYREAEASVANPAELNKWAAEAYFFKAWDYYWKIVAFGEVPWYEHYMNTNSKELYKARTPRAELVDSVMKCLEYAEANIQNGGTPDGRINKEKVLFLKARFCLFEGTFRKYHTEINLQSTANGFLEKAAKAAQDIIDMKKYSLFNKGNNPYWNEFKFNSTSAASDINTEGIMTRVYDASNIGHGTSRYFNMNRGNASGRYSKGATKSLVDDYLCIDGKPITSSALFMGYEGDDWRELDNRDPRLRQTVVKPGEFITIFDRENEQIDQAVNGLKYPEITYNCPTVNQTATGGPCVTGYEIIKHWTNAKIDNGSTSNGTQSATIFRYAEVLLMLAEAKAELGTITNADLDLTVNALRQRAGFDFVKYPGSRLTLENVPADPRMDKQYSDYADYVPSPILREIRRERRIEMAIEGVRREDLVRWKCLKFITIPIRGMKFTPEKQALYDGSNTSKEKNAPKATLNSDVFIDSDGFIICYPKSSNVVDGAIPWDEKLYYNPIPLQELTLNKNLTQSKGWTDISRDNK